MSYSIISHTQDLSSLKMEVSTSVQLVKNMVYKNIKKNHFFKIINFPFIILILIGKLKA